MRTFTAKLSILFVTIFPTAALAQLNVTNNHTATQLVEKLVGNGVSYSNPVLNCDTGANGIFNVVSSNLGLDSGIVLTSGRAGEGNNFWAFEFGVNSPAMELASTEFFGAGDMQLDSLLAPSGVFSQDACVLEFDFIPTGDTLQFRYVFGSEEYTDYSCDIYNDIFAFFLTGPGYPNAANIALIPGTTIPVAVNSTTNMTINFPFDPALCTGMGPGSPFSQYYIDNAMGTTVVYNGFTTVFTAMAPVQACSTYHIKLAIADASDGILDSGVFLEAGSFKSNAVSLSFVSSLPTNSRALLEGCLTGTVIVKRAKALPTAQTVPLLYSGTAIQNVDFSPAPDSVIIPAFDSMVTFTISAVQDGITEGTETIGIRTVGSCSNAADSIGIPLLEQLPLDLISEDTAFCRGAVPPVPLHVSGDPNMQYTWTATPQAVIQNPADSFTFSTPVSTTTYTVTATVAGCPGGSASFTVTVEEPPVVNVIPSDTTVCLRDSMQLNVVVQPEDPRNIYAWTPAEHLSNPSAREPLFFSQLLFDYTYQLTVTSPAGCSDTASVVIRAKPPVVLTDVTANATIPYGNKIQLNADGAFYYTWLPDKFLDYPNIKDPVATPTEPVLFTVFGLNEYGCRDTATVMIDIDYTMNEFIPTAFSPNNDGLNDVFRIGNLKYQRLMEFRIFNRWGQQLFSTTNPSEGWDGTFKGARQEVGVYHYLVRIALPGGEARMYKGDITLVR